MGDRSEVGKLGMAVLGWVNWFRVVVVVWSAVVMCEGLEGVVNQGDRLRVDSSGGAHDGCRGG